MASKHRQVGALIVRPDERNRSMYIKTVSVMLSKKVNMIDYFDEGEENVSLFAGFSKT